MVQKEIESQPVTLKLAVEIINNQQPDIMKLKENIIFRNVKKRRSCTRINYSSFSF